MAKSGASLNWGGLDKAFENAGRRLADRQQLLATVGDALVSSTSKRFEEGQGPEGKAWEPSARATPTEDKFTAVRRDEKGRILKGSGKKIKGNQGGKTLADTGRLLHSIDYAVTPDSVMVGSNVEYARIHQMGGQAGRGHRVTIPARPYLGVSEQDREEVQRILQSFLIASFKR